MTSRQHAESPKLALLSRRQDRRQGYRVDPDFQTRFRTLLLAFSVLIVIAVALLATGVRYVMEDPGAFLTSPWVPAVLFASALAIGLGIFRLSDRISHRYCGPVRRISNTLEAARRGERPSAIQLRRNDEFHELAETVNATLRTLGLMDD